MLEGLRVDERERLLLYVLFANTQPKVHSSWNATWMSASVDWMGTYEVDAEQAAELTRLEGMSNCPSRFGVF